LREESRGDGEPGNRENLMDESRGGEGCRR